MEQSIKDIVLKVFKTILIIFLLVILVINTYIMIQAKSKPNSVPSIFGYKPFVVLSGSMETELNIGDLVFVKEVDSNDLKVQDIIAFRSDDKTVTTHRIIDTVSKKGETCFKTKGDNNNTRDDKIVCSKDIEGKYHSKIPKLGHVIIFIQEPLGFTVMMLIIVIICIFIYFTSDKKDNQKVLASEEEMKEFEEYKKEKERREEKKKNRNNKNRNKNINRNEGSEIKKTHKNNVSNKKNMNYKNHKNINNKNNKSNVSNKKNTSNRKNTDKK